MNHTRLWTSAVIIAVIIIVSFMLSVPHTSEVPRPPASAKTAPAVPTVTLHDAFKKGVHTITGSLMASTPCTAVTATVSLAGASSNQSILVAVSMAEDMGVCLQEPARINFSATINAKAALPIEATVNGLSATTTAS